MLFERISDFTDCTLCTVTLKKKNAMWFLAQHGFMYSTTKQSSVKTACVCVQSTPEWSPSFRQWGKSKVNKQYFEQNQKVSFCFDVFQNYWQPVNE